MSTSWRDYEEAARHILSDFKKELGLDEVQGKQDVNGKISGTSWEVDEKGIAEADGATIIIECKRYPKDKINQNTLGSLVYRIYDRDQQEE